MGCSECLRLTIRFERAERAFESALDLLALSPITDIESEDRGLRDNSDKTGVRLAVSATPIRPRVINVDGHPAYASAIEELKQSGELGRFRPHNAGLAHLAIGFTPGGSYLACNGDHRGSKRTGTVGGAGVFRTVSAECPDPQPELRRSACANQRRRIPESSRRIPFNRGKLMVTAKGSVKLLDFGLAKRNVRERGDASNWTLCAAREVGLRQDGLKRR
jgi:hypothetical protein